MAPTVKKATTAFLFYQKDQLAKIRASMGLSMGDAMTQLAANWRALSPENRAVYEQMENADRQRFLRESAAADAEAARIQQERRAALTVQEGESHAARGARGRVNAERAEREAKAELRRKRQTEREAELDEEEVAAKKAAEARKKRETELRRQKKKEQDAALANKHSKLDREHQKKAAQRLEYLLKQSDIFGKLKGGGQQQQQQAQPGGAGGGGQQQPAAPPEKKKRGRSPKPGGAAAAAAAANKSGSNVHHLHREESAEDPEMDEEPEEEHVFLTKQPTCIKFGQLKPYQLEALNWMIHLAEKGLNGILADEMGLGKTVQSISILAYHWEYLRLQGPHLVCVPKSTLSNWMNELKRWCPSLRALKFHGSREDREYMMEHYFTSEAAAGDGRRPDRPQVRDEETGELVDDNSDNPLKFDVCVTTYEIANAECKTLQKFAWKYLIIDEAHRLKNDASMFSKTVRSFRTANRLLLTGTPLQNNLHELWALLNFLLPDIFSSAEQFDEWFDLEIDDEEAKKTMISQLHKILRPFMLRRLKADVAKGLPPKTETILMVGMSKMQKQLYKKLLLRDLDSITGNSGKHRTAVLNIVMQLRKCCGHPYLFEGVEDRTLDPLGEHLVENCGKLSMVDKLLKRLHERGNRVLLFTQMTRVLDILEDFMVMRGYKYCRIDGNTNYDDRESSIDVFNAPGSEKFCFLLSTRAGGLGINLQTADTCILYDSDWNPQQDLQAQDRCHRLGQLKPVQVFRLVSENTVEEKIVERAQQKLKLDAMVVQQGRLKEKDKVTKEEVMAAVRFGADAVFRSEESTITDLDIDTILAQGAQKTKELTEKIKKKEKGDLLDFSLDGGISAQTFEGVDYSDKELRDHLRMLAANSMGKRERRPPPTSYNPIIHSKKSMVVNNRRIKLPKSLRIPQMEDHHFYNRERLLELGALEFETYAALREANQLPPREVMDRKRTLLPPELAQEKLELLAEGFGDWSRSQYYAFVKATAKYGRDDIASIAAEMDMAEEAVAPYSRAFWRFGPTELKGEWERVVANIERGEKKRSKQAKLTSLLQEFVGTFDDARQEMTFANKGTTHFAQEQDRALLCAVNKHGYGNWDTVREEVRSDTRLLFQHAVQGMTVQTIGKRCDYRMRQMEKELEAREKQRKNKRSAAVTAALQAVQAIKATDVWDAQTRHALLEGRPSDVQPLSRVLHGDALVTMEERWRDRMTATQRLREIEVQVAQCRGMAEETRQAILRGEQYVNYSHITLKNASSVTGTGTGGNSNSNSAAKNDADAAAGVAMIKSGISMEAHMNPLVLAEPACKVCDACTRSNTKLCEKRLQLRNRLIEKWQEQHGGPCRKRPPLTVSSSSSPSSSSAAAPSKKRKDHSRKSPKPSLSSSMSSASAATSTSASSKPQSASGSSTGGGGGGGAQPPPPKKKKVLYMQRPDGQLKPRVTSQGNKRMTIPPELFPEFCRRIGVRGTGERMNLINQFVDDFPTISVRQVTLRFSEVTVRELPGCVDPNGPMFPEGGQQRKSGRAFLFYLRPCMYQYLPAHERPPNYEPYAEADQILYDQEMAEKKRKQELASKKNSSNNNNENNNNNGNNGNNGNSNAASAAANGAGSSTTVVNGPVGAAASGNNTTSNGDTAAAAATTAPAMTTTATEGDDATGGDGGPARKKIKTGYL